MPAAMSGVLAWGGSSGCRSNGRTIRRRRRSTTCLRFQAPARSTNGSMWRISAGESSATTRSSNRNSDSTTAKGVAGAASIALPVCASRPMASCSPNASTDTGPAPKKTAYDAKRLPYPKITSRAVQRRAQRHVPDSIPTLRHRLSILLAALVPRCPCCGKRRTDPFL